MDLREIFNVSSPNTLIHLIAAIIILIAGFILGSLLSKLTRKILNELETNKILKEQAGIRLPVEEFISKSIKYIIYIIAIIWSLNQLGLTTRILEILLITILVILIILAAIAIIFRNKIKMMLFKSRNKSPPGQSSQGGMPPGTRPPFPPFRGPMPYPRAQPRIINPQASPPMRRPIPNKDKEMEETMAKLKEMSK